VVGVCCAASDQFRIPSDPIASIRVRKKLFISNLQSTPGSPSACVALSLLDLASCVAVHKSHPDIADAACEDRDTRLFA
jgi:hypothetical protein